MGLSLTRISSHQGKKTKGKGKGKKAKKNAAREVAEVEDVLDERDLIEEREPQ